MSWLAIFKCSQTKRRRRTKGKAKLKLSVCTWVVPNYPILQPGMERWGRKGRLGGVALSSSSRNYVSLPLSSQSHFCVWAFILYISTSTAWNDYVGSRWQILKSFTIYCGRKGREREQVETDWPAAFHLWIRRDVCFLTDLRGNHVVLLCQLTVFLCQSEGADLFSLTRCSILRCCTAIYSFAL